jgi:hypothetical protein
VTIGEAFELARHPAYLRFCELVEGPWTAMTSVEHSAFSGQLYLKWEGVNGVGHSVRINPRGPDLEEALTEFADRCRKLAELPAVGTVPDERAPKR